MNLTTVRKSPAKEVVIRLLSFLIVSISDTIIMVLLFFQFELKIAVYAALKKKKIHEVTTYVNYFFKKS